MIRSMIRPPCHGPPLAAGLLVGLLAGLSAGCSGWPEARYSPLERGDQPTADAVVLLDEGRLSFEHRRELTFVFRRHTRIKVLTPRGRRHAEVAVPLDAWTTLEHVETRSYGPDGADEQRSGIDAVYDVPARPDAGVLYADARVARTLVPGVDVGDVLEYRYTVHSSRLFALPGWVFQWDVPVVRSRMLVEAAAPVKWSFARRGRLDAIEPTTEGRGLDAFRVFERRDLPAFEAEPYGPPPAEQLERLRLSDSRAPASASWGGLAGWYRDLMDPQLALPEVAATAARAAVAEATPREKLLWVDGFVRRHIRYVATHVGIGAFQPHPVEEVLDAGYGDCKDMVSLYVALGRALDLEVHPVLVGTSGHGVPDPELATVSAFDHVIAATRIDGEWIFADPTDRDSAAGTLPLAVSGRPGLRIGPTDEALIDLPPPAADGDRAEWSWRLEDDGRVRVEARFVGRSARMWDGLSPDPAARARLARRLFFEDDPQAVVEAVAVEADAAAATVTVDGRWPGLWIPLADGSEGLALHRFIGRSAEIRVPADRESDVYLGPPRARVVRLDLPWSAKADGVTPAAGAEENPLGASRWTVEQADGRLRLVYDLTIAVPRVGADGLPGLRALMEHAATIGRGLLVRPGGAS